VPDNRREDEVAIFGPTERRLLAPPTSRRRVKHDIGARPKKQKQVVPVAHEPRKWKRDVRDEGFSRRIMRMGKMGKRSSNCPRNGGDLSRRRGGLS
jgi:hypothetical protein